MYFVYILPPKIFSISIKVRQLPKTPLNHSDSNNSTFNMVTFRKGEFCTLNWCIVEITWKKILFAVSFKLISLLDICYFPSACVTCTWYIQVVNCAQIHLTLKYVYRLYVRLQQKKVGHCKMKTNSKQLFLLFLSLCYDLKTFYLLLVDHI